LKWNVFSYRGQAEKGDIYVRYRLNDDKWSDWTLKREIIFVDLKHGSYKVSFQALDQLNTVNEKLVTASFYIDPPIFLSPLYYVPIIFLFIVVFSITIWYLNKARKAKYEILNLNINLEDKVKDRTAQLKITLDVLKEENNERKKAELELIKAKEEISNALDKEKELNEMKTQFISMISHEYRTPLTVILSSSELIKILSARENSKGYEPHVKNISNSVLIMTKMLEDTLFFNRNENESQKLSFSKIDLLALCDESIANAKKFDKDDRNIFFTNEAKVSSITSNYSALKKIIINLMFNSIKYSKAKSNIELKLIDREDEIILELIDEGIGIPKEDLENIFEPFFRSKKHIGIVQGTGLGLAIVQKLCIQLKIKINIESKENIGTKIRLSIPKEEHFVSLN
jgi:signal transduction histidine kinase